MKKLFLTLLTALAVSAGAAFAQIEPTIVHEVGFYKMEGAMNVNNEGVAEVMLSYAYKSGSDIEAVIFNRFGGVEKQFTIKNVINNPGKCEYYIEGLDIHTASLESIVVSRNLFVKNDKWCILLNITEFENDLPVSKGTYVIDEDGKNHGVFPKELPDGWSYSSLYMSQLYQGTPFLAYYSMDCYRLYSFTGKSGIEPTLVSSFKSAYPNPLPEGATFNVSLPQAADDATFFCVTDMSGRQVLRRKVAAGETSYRLSNARFSHGHYIYTVIYSDGTAVSGRLMAE